MSKTVNRCYRHLPGGILFTPGPLTTTSTVKQAMQVDFGSRDQKFMKVIREVRQGLLKVGQVNQPNSPYTAILMQGSGSMGIEAIVGSTTPPAAQKGKFLVIKNGAYGERLNNICKRYGIPTIYMEFEENRVPDVAVVSEVMKKNPDITNVGVVHCETTTGILNPIRHIGALVRQHLPHASYFVDAMSSFGGVPCDVGDCQIDYMVTSSNKCIQGVPGFSCILANHQKLQQCDGWARSYCLDLGAQLRGLDSTGQFQNTPPVHSILAFHQALKELDAEGGVQARSQRYQATMRVILSGLKQIGFQPYLNESDTETFGWIILTFLSPHNDPKWHFPTFYQALNEQGIVIYPGKLTQRDCFRVGCIGDLNVEDAACLVEHVGKVVQAMGLGLKQ